MAETFAQYTQRIKGYLGGKDPLQSMQETAAEIKALLQNLPEAVWKKSPAPGKWSIGEIIAHLCDTELAAGFRFRAIAGGDDGVPIIGYDQERWAVAGNYKAARIEDSLKSFLAVREMNLRFLHGLPQAAWTKYGTHSERGRETLGDLAEMVAGHDLNHILQIKNILSSAQAA
jgi:DinB family protein